MSRRTPYDTGERLEPKLWINPVSNDTSRTAADYGKVDFDNEESATVFTAHAERDGEGYVLKVNDLSGNPIRVEVGAMYSGSQSPIIQPSLALQAKVQETIANLSTETERIESEVYWQDGKALILVGGETGYRKQQAIMVYEPGYAYGDTMSAIVKSWASGTRDTRVS